MSSTATRQSPLARMGIFILVLIGLNVVFRILGWNLRISIIGSIILTVVVGGIMAATSR